MRSDHVRTNRLQYGGAFSTLQAVICNTPFIISYTAEHRHQHEQEKQYNACAMNGEFIRSDFIVWKVFPCLSTCTLVKQPMLLSDSYTVLHCSITYAKLFAESILQTDRHTHFNIGIYLSLIANLHVHHCLLILQYFTFTFKSHYD